MDLETIFNTHVAQEVQPFVEMVQTLDWSHGAIALGIMVAALGVSAVADSALGDDVPAPPQQGPLPPLI